MHPDDRFARLLIAAGALFSLTVLAQTGNSVLYSIGRVSVWLVIPVLLYLMLVFPSGRLVARRDRRLITAVAALAATLYFPTALIVPHYPEPSPWSVCDADCPANAFAVVPVDPAFVENVIQPLREILIVAAVLAVAVILAQRRRHSGPMLRRALTPVLAVAVVQVVAFVIYQWSRRGGAVPATVDLLGWVWVLSLPAVALSFAAGLAEPPAPRGLRAAGPDPPPARAGERHRAAGQPRRRARGSVTAGRLLDARRAGTLGRRERLAGAGARGRAGDRGHRRAWWTSGGWPPWSTRRTLAPDTALIRAAASYGLVVLENTRLIGELQSSLQRLSESETRTAVAAQGERQRIERDLHDGAQQRLVAHAHQPCGDRRALERRLRPTVPGSSPSSPRRSSRRSTTCGRWPTSRTRTCSRARAWSRRCGRRQRARPCGRACVSHGMGRFRRDVETTVYFSCLEAVQNAVKHAHGASHITVLLDAGDGLRFEVRDDGAGFPAGPPRPAPGSRTSRTGSRRSAAG